MEFPDAGSRTNENLRCLHEVKSENLSCSAIVHKYYYSDDNFKVCV